MPPLIRIDARFQTTSSQEKSKLWHEATIVLLHIKVGSLVNVYTGTTLLGQGQLVAHHGKYAIRLIELY